MSSRTAGKKWCDDALGFKAMGFVPEVHFRVEIFCKKHTYRFDFARADILVCVEIQGGIWYKQTADGQRKGAHNGAGHVRDMIKYNHAQELGWVVLQYQPGRVDWNQISRVVAAREKALTKDMQAGSIKA